MAAATAAFKKDDYKIEIYQLDQLSKKNEFLEKLEGICNRILKFPLEKNISINKKIKEILGDEIIDVVNSDKTSVNLLSIGKKDGNLYTYEKNKKNTVVKVEEKYYQKINKKNDWKFITLSKKKVTLSPKKIIENKDLTFATLNLTRQFDTNILGGKNINFTFIALLCNNQKEILAFIIFSNKNNNIFIDAACGKDGNGEHLLINMFEYFKEKNFEKIELTALPLVYETWKTKYKFIFKNDDANAKKVNENNIKTFIEKNLKFFFKSNLGCNENTEYTFKDPLANNLSENYCDNGIPMELNLANFKNIDSNLKITVKIPSTQEKYFTTIGLYNNSEILKFLNSRAGALPSKSTAILPDSPAPSPASPSSVAPSLAPPVSPASPASPASPLSVSQSAASSPVPPASVILQPRPKMDKVELTAIVSKLEASRMLINYGNILKYRDVNMSSSTDLNNICLWNCQRQTRSQEVKNTGQFYSQCEFKNRHLVLDTEFYKILCNDIIKTSGDNNNYKYIIDDKAENFTLCHNHIKQFLGVKMIFFGKKTGNEVQIKNLLHRKSNDLICYYRNPQFVNKTFYKDLGNFIKKNNDRSLKNCYFKIEKDSNGKELSHFEVKALKDIQKGEIVYF